MPYDPVTAEPLSRERLTALLGEAEAARERRGRWQGWLLGAGLAILALGLPQERLWGGMDLARQVAGNGERTAGLVFPLAVALRSLFGLGAEQACFLLAAVTYGLCVPALMGMMRSIGFLHGPSLAAALVAVLSPVAWIGCTTPLDLAPGILGATLLLWTLFRPQERVPSGYHWRASTTLALAFLLRPENALLFPAVVWAVSVHRGLGKLRGPAAGLVIALAVTSPLLGLFTGSPERAELGWRTLDMVLAGRAPSASNLLLGLVAVPLGLGASAWGVYVLLLGRRSPEETPAPKWVVPWCLVVLAPIVGGTPWSGPVGGFLIPAAAVGLADWLTRTAGEERARRRAFALLAIQLVATGLVAVGWRLGDPLREWRATARAALEPDDAVVAADARVLYLTGVRWGLAAHPAPASGAARQDLPAELSADVARGARRLVLVEDAPEPRIGGDLDPRPPTGGWPATGSVLDEEVEVQVLTAGGMRPVRAGEAWQPLPASPAR